ncbi:sensor domain-containing diguanylate cyclase [Jatrophihabitans sp.]|uniref:sensor domain-containing diguanylate cyclase n=1 Tax=Jatrophihabitans sp. TaxID=1932789 RepID=UPI0030C6C266|nr:diguanylate cyclase/phosphodiesterase [Jatrophihabitans sp.]
MLVASAAVGLALADASGRFVYTNDAYSIILNVPLGSLVGQSLRVVVGPVDLTDDTTLYTEEHQRGDRWIAHTVRRVDGLGTAQRWYVLTAQDNSTRRQAEQGLRDLTATLAERAVRDPLTGVANRVLLDERLRGVLARDKRTGSSSGLIFIDLDGFKAINDTYGHDAGDAVLQEIAHRLTQCIRPVDTASRLGGDEFVLIAEGTSEYLLQLLVGVLEREIDQPIMWGEVALSVGASIGTALSVAGSPDSAALLRQADAAMYERKRLRKLGIRNRRTEDQAQPDSQPLPPPGTQTRR